MDSCYRSVFVTWLDEIPPEKSPHVKESSHFNRQWRELRAATSGLIKNDFFFKKFVGFFKMICSLLMKSN